MVVIRPIAAGDLDSLVLLASQVGYGLTTLPCDRDLLADRIRDSLAAFERITQKPRGDRYLFVMEDLRTGQILGTSGIVSKVGGFEPFYAYKVETAIHESEELKVRKAVRFLKLVAEHNGPCEIGSLFLSPGFRQSGAGRLLSLARFLFMADHAEHFDPLVIAEMRGVIDEQGHSPLWDALGRHFFDVDFARADYLSMVNKKFIADLMPAHPIYIELLPPAAQAVIGQVHTDTRAALRILEDEGFKWSGMVDIFEGGPIVNCPRHSIRTVRQSETAPITQIVNERIDAPELVIGNTRRDFRACTAPVERASDGIRVTGETALTLQVRVGDAVRFAPLRRPKPQARTHEHDKQPVSPEAFE